MRSHPIVCTILGLAVLAGACGPGTCIDPSQLTYRIRRSDAPLQKGKATTIDLVVVNQSDLYMLVEGIRGPHLSPGGADALVGAAAGSLEEDGAGGYRHNLEAQQETPPIVATGLLPPGQKLPIRVEVIPDAPAGEFVVRYWGLSLEEAATFLLFPALKDGRVDPSHYVPWPVDDLKLASGPADDSGRRSPLSTTVLLGSELARTPPSCKVHMPYRLKLDQSP